MEKNKNHINQMQPPINGLKFVGLIAKKSPEVYGFIQSIRNSLRKYDIELILESQTAEYFSKSGLNLSEILKKTNFIISLGGDGTLISTARILSDKEIFILGIHAGSLGFLTDIKVDDFEMFLHDFFNGEYEIQRPYMLEASLERDDKIFKKTAFNDVVITRSHISSMAKIDAFLNEKHFNTYYGDGVIVSSPMGSTAYNTSAGGAIVYPMCDVFCLTPICSHSLTQRPLILPKKYVVSFENAVSSEVSVVIDGQDVFDMSEFKRVSVRLKNTKIYLIHNKKHDYFDVLKEKLRWGHG